MALIAIQEAEAGVQSVNLAAAVGPDTIQAGIRNGTWELPIVLVVKNTDAATKTVTIDGVAYIVPATTGLAVIPVRRGYGVQLVTVTYSAVTGVSVGALRLSRSD
jgi:hypothetical protein